MRRGRAVLDIIYHNLRLVHLSGDDNMKVAVRRITTHLMTVGGDYDALLSYLEYYGKRFLAPHACDLAQHMFHDKSVVVELGAGTGWFGEAIAQRLGASYLATDKRDWTEQTNVVDLETEDGLRRINFEGRSDVLVVAVNLLHCLEPAWRLKLYSQLAKVSFMVAEYRPTKPTQRMSYDKQIEHLGCYRFSPSELGTWVPNAKDTRIGQYYVMLHRKEVV